MSEQSENKGSSLPSDIPPHEKAFFDSIRWNFLKGGTPILNGGQNDFVDFMCNQIYCSWIEAITELFLSKDTDFYIVMDIPSDDIKNPDISLQMNMYIKERMLVLWERFISQKLNKGTNHTNWTTERYRYGVGLIETWYPASIIAIIFQKSKL